MDERKEVNPTAARRLLALLSLLTTVAAGWAFYRALLVPGVSAITAAVLLLLFVTLFFWIALSFWIATAGFLRLLTAGQAICAAAPPASEAAALAVRSAILMPVYNESPSRVFAGLRAIHESLQATGQGAAFDFFVLSDTTNPDVWLAEELAWAQLNQTISAGSPVYYRHRPKNVSRKSGNIADFCRRWGAAYQYMVVLDADSVMSGETIVELVRRMEADAQLGILQTSPVPVNCGSLFARCQQFAAAVYGPIFLEGFAWWSGAEGNYFGHNAIIRLAAFTQACGLPKLSGSGPLGGEILSHDFVEAALIRRAGYKVCVANDLEGSYEECPPTLIEFAQRDRRWCQGNLQHVRIALAAGIHPVSRLHMGMGAMSYLSSPLWLLSLVIGFFVAALPRAPLTSASSAVATDPVNGWGIGLFFATMALLLLPKLWSYLALLRDPRRLARCGGHARAAASALLETIVSMLVAPILMAFHSTFVITTLLGHRVEWNAQQRGDTGQQFLAAVAAHWRQTLVGLLAALVVWLFAATLLLWLTPVLLGLVLAIPLSIVLGSVALGQSLGRRGLLLIPEETATPRVLARHRHFLAQAGSKDAGEPRGLFRRVLTDPALLALHRSILEATDGCVPANPQVIALTRQELVSGGAPRVSSRNRLAILSDPAALAALHLFVWTTPGSAQPAGKA